MFMFCSCSVQVLFMFINILDFAANKFLVFTLYLVTTRLTMIDVARAVSLFVYLFCLTFPFYFYRLCWNQSRRCQFHKFDNKLAWLSFDKILQYMLLNTIGYAAIVIAIDQVKYVMLLTFIFHVTPLLAIMYKIVNIRLVIRFKYDLVFEIESITQQHTT